MQWNLTMLAVHVIAAGLAGVLYVRAPCWMQKLVILGIFIGFTVMIVAYAAALAGVWWWWHVTLLAFAIEHVALLLYVFRLVWQGGAHGTASHRAAPAG
jgi:hypothetical protein